MSLINLPIPRRVWIAVALSASATYVAWNIWWLSHARLPPSMLTWASGIPSPTTGGSRAFRALLRGDWTASFHYNPMTLPIVCISAVSLIWIVTRQFQRKPLDLPPAMAWAWLVILLLAWTIQLTRWMIS